MIVDKCWPILLKQWKLVAICTVVVGLGTFLGSQLITPVYQASVLVQVTLNPENSFAVSNNALASNQLVQTEVQLATSDPVLREVASHYTNLTPETLASATTATAKLNTELFEIDVQSTNPLRAAQLANDVANTLIKQQLTQTQVDNERMRRQYQQQVDMTRSNIDANDAKISDLQAQIAETPGNQGRVASLQAQLNSAQNQGTRLQQQYDQWQTILAQIDVSAAQNDDFLHIVQPARPPKSPVCPQLLLNTAIGLVVGLFIGLLLVLLLEQLNTRVSSREELEQMCDWPILGTAWQINPAKGEQEIIVDLSKGNANVEAYRLLRTNIGFASIEKSVRSIVVTSALPNEGKSTVATNLAIVMAKAGKKVLLVDANLRHPTLHLKLRLPTNKPGLSEAIVEMQQLLTHTQQPLPIIAEQYNAALSRSVYTGSLPNLRVMPSGLLPPEVPKLLESHAMESLLRVLEKCNVDVVIFDTPPLLGFSDVSILMRKTDAVLFVVDIANTRKKSIQRARAQLAQAGVRVLGCMVNKESRDHKSSSHYYNRYDGEKSHENGHVRQLVTMPMTALLTPFGSKNRSR